jgi:hypothetical protein
MPIATTFRTGGRRESGVVRAQDLWIPMCGTGDGHHGEVTDWILVVEQREEILVASAVTPFGTCW